MRTQLKIEIVKAGLTYSELARRTNVFLPDVQRISEQSVTRLVTERSKPKQKQAEAIAKVLGCRWDELFNI